MATRIEHVLTYDAPAADVAAMLSDKAFRDQVCVDMRTVSHSVTIDGDVDAKKVVIEMEQPTEGVPGFAKKFVGATTTIVQSEDWKSPTHGDIHVTIPGKPGEMVGTAILTEADGVTTETVQLDVTVRIPLVGGKIEDLIGGLLIKALKSENRTGRAWLAR